MEPMKMTKKLSALLVALVMALSLTVPAFAATVTLPDVAGAPGEILSVPVLLKNNPGLVSARIKVGYNADVLELVSKEIGDFPANGYSWGLLHINPFVINFCDAVSYEDYTCELLATLTFKIKEDAAVGDGYYQVKFFVYFNDANATNSFAIVINAPLIEIRVFIIICPFG